MEIQNTILSFSGFMSLSNSGSMELIVLLAIILIVFGPKRLPQLARSIGKSITDFKRGLNDVKYQIEKTSDESESVDAGKPTENNT